MRGTGGPPWNGAAHGTAAGAEKGGFFALVRAWAAALVVLAVTEYIQITYIRELFVTEAGPESFGAGLLLIQLPDLVCVALAAWVAGRVHREPFRDAVRAHLAAVFAVPVFLVVVSIALQWGRASAVGLLLSSAVAVTGAAIGYLVDRLQEGDR
ncbi:hypothetical protein [Streptomyces sp. CC228A]|uniref:hypothetical protein n=1 Tax=Streptomyces sp. CC228A TaxID=2898186 RepID=UPI001F173895|nr:hypothetical protein [Streptomyces sp. CC228A]